MNQRVQDLSETDLLAAFTPLLPVGSGTIVGPGDDAAVVRAASGAFVVSTDVLVQDRHFRQHWSTGVDVGYRAAMQNLADIAAMGARPHSIVVGLVLPGHTEVAWVQDLARGFALACQDIDVGVVGGDLSSGEQLVVAVTVHGELQGPQPAVLRSGAQVGDVVAVCGTLGFSAAGLWWLTENAPHQSPAIAQPLADAQPPHGVWQEAVDKFRRPASPLKQGPVARAHGATAMMDISDGLWRDAGRIAVASQVSIELDGAALAPYAARFEASAAAWEWVLTGGEEHSLLATFPADRPLPSGWVQIGSVQQQGVEHAGQGSSNELVTITNMPPEAAEVVNTFTASGGGWDHFV